MSTKETNKFSIEFYPPRTAEGRAKLDVVHEQLEQLKPDFFSVTYGAGGSTKKGTQQIVLRYARQGANVAPHLSFGGTDDDEVRALLTTYREAGINRLVALRGDLPSGAAIHHRYAVNWWNLSVMRAAIIFILMSLATRNPIPIRPAMKLM